MNEKTTPPYFDRRPDGAYNQPEGRFSDWLVPPGSFGYEPVLLDGTPVLAIHRGVAQVRRH